MSSARFSAQPADSGLYRREFEHDACGVAMVATMRGSAGHDIVEHALTALRNLEHRGATGADPLVGDGAGILTQIPDAFFREVVDFDLPVMGAYAVGTAFLPREEAGAGRAGHRAHRAGGGPAGPGLARRPCRHRDRRPGGPRLHAGLPPGLRVGHGGTHGGHRARPPRVLPPQARRARDRGVLPLAVRPHDRLQGHAHDRAAGAVLPGPVGPALRHQLALVHSRFSTNTFPSWPLAHPYRVIAHNGEINTVKGNRNWMRARESQLASDLIPGDLNRLFPICSPDASDSASFDEVLELLHLGGRSLPHAVLMMIPEAWENHEEMDAARRAFYEFHSTFMEPWDGPAAVTFTDGSLIGAVLDRNGLRPARYSVTDDGLVVLASETGVLGGLLARRPQGPPPARPHVPRGHRARPHRARRRGQGVPGRPAPVRGVAARRTHPPRRPAGARAHRPHCGLGRPPPADLRLHPGRAEDPAVPDGQDRGRGPRLHGHRHADRRAVGAATAHLRLLHPPVRPGDQPSAGRHPRGAFVTSSAP